MNMQDGNQGEQYDCNERVLERVSSFVVEFIRENDCCYAGDGSEDVSGNLEYVSLELMEESKPSEPLMGGGSGNGGIHTGKCGKIK